MIAKNLINYMIPPLKVTDEISKASLWMEELRLSELPVTDQGKFLGLYTEGLLYDQPVDQSTTVGDCPLEGRESIVHHDSHYYDVLKTAYANGVRLVAVRDDQDQYIGVISIEDIVEAFARTLSVNTPGAILVLSLNQRDYVLSDICRIIELNEAKVLSSQTLHHSDETEKLTLTLKINKEEVSHIISSLEAKGYHVSESFNKSPLNDRDKEYFDGLMNYLKF